MALVVYWMLLGLACTPAEFKGWWKMPEVVRVAVPHHRQRVVADHVPILVRIPRRLKHADIRLLVDGERVDVGSIARRRWWSGSEADFIGELSTVGLASGEHTIELVSQDGEGERWTARRVFIVDRLLDRLEIRVVDGLDAPRAGRVEVFAEDGTPFHTGSPGDELADPTRRDAVRSSVFVVGGLAYVRLPPGRYSLLASGGIRDGVVERKIRIPEDQAVTLRLPRLIQTPDEVTADLHVHTGLSGDSFVPDIRRMQSLVAGGVEVGVITEHNRVRDARPALELLGLKDHLTLLPGVEFRFGPRGKSIGHGNAFPLSPAPVLVRPGTRSPAEVVALWRDHGEAHQPSGLVEPTLIQLNHPRGIQFWPDRDHQLGTHALFSELGLEPGLPLGAQDDVRLQEADPVRGQRLVDVDALEILNRFSVEGWRSVRLDWFSLMNQGWFPTGTGNSDSHSVEVERPGFPVNLVRVAPSKRASPDAFVQAIRAGRVGVSTGPIVRLVVHTPDGTQGLPGDTLVGPVDSVEVMVEVVASPWVPVPEVRLVVDGEVHHKVDLREDDSRGRPILRGRWRWRVPLSGDTWMVAEAGWGLRSLERPVDGFYPRVAPGHVPIGFTNPVRIDGGGDGRWTPRVDPGLP
jgi:hypothetical protein